ncbi:hypothetical protein A9Q81_21005 [Gammaproteobacteria bacterium 42_54_T18]|nr:hypothetical protein A9Q81_21005 [Gammaproteobacteria bacterium 42_54_T18]
MAIRYLFFVFVILCTSGMAPLCIATPIVVDYSVIPKTIFTPPTESKPTHSNALLSPQTINELISQQQNDAAPPMSIRANAKEFQPNKELQSSEEPQSNDELLPTQSPQKDKETLIHLGFNFNGFHQTNTLEESSLPQQSNQENQHHASLNLKSILRDTIKDNEVLMELAEGTIEIYRSFSDSSTTESFQTTSPTVSFGNENVGSSRDFLDAPPLISAQQQAPRAQRSWGEETFFDKLIQFCFSWKGLLTLCGFLIFNSILFKLV